jgi:hypothetical protein
MGLPHFFGRIKMQVQELGRYKRMTASGQIVPRNGSVLAFLCTTAGTLQITEGVEPGGSDIVSSLTMTAGTFYPLGFEAPLGAYAVLGGSAVGTFII